VSFDPSCPFFPRHSGLSARSLGRRTEGGLHFTAPALSWGVHHTICLLFFFFFFLSRYVRVRLVVRVGLSFLHRYSERRNAMHWPSHPPHATRPRHCPASIEPIRVPPLSQAGRQAPSRDGRTHDAGAMHTLYYSLTLFYRFIFSLGLGKRRAFFFFFCMITDETTPPQHNRLEPGIDDTHTS
jgi:hypothetical protein